MSGCKHEAAHTHMATDIRQPSHSVCYSCLHLKNNGIGAELTLASAVHEDSVAVGEEVTSSLSFLWRSLGEEW